MGKILFVKRTPLPLFYQRRASRIIPAFILFVVVIYSFGYLSHHQFGALDVFATLTFLRTYLPLGTDIWQSTLPIGHIWSLNIEEHGYVLMSLITLIATFRTRAWLPLFLIGCGGIVMQLVYIYNLLPAPSNFDIRTECALTHLMLSAAYCQRAHTLKHKITAWMPFTAFFVAVFCYTPLFPWWSRLLIAPFLLAFVVNHLSETWGFVRSFFSNPVLRLLGIWSYSIYLWQQPFYQYKSLFPLGVALCLAVAAGLVSFYAIENPARAYLNRRWSPIAKASPH